MKKLILLISAVAISTIAFSQSEDPALRAEIQKVFRQYDALVLKADIRALLNMYHPGFHVVDVQGKSTAFAEFKTSYMEMWAITKDASLKSTVVHVTGSFDEATAWVSCVSNYSVKQGDRWVKMKLTSRYAETLKRGADGWKIFYTQGLPLNEPWPFAAFKACN
jgi:ketosteroid isomerase-like protein